MDFTDNSSKSPALISRYSPQLTGANDDLIKGIGSDFQGHQYRLNFQQVRLNGRDIRLFGSLNGPAWAAWKL